MRAALVARLVIVSLCAIAWHGAARAQIADVDLPKAVTLPPGFSITKFATAPAPRSLLVVPELSAVFIGSTTSTLSAAFYKDGAPRAERTISVGTAFNAPNGVAWQDGWLYVAETHRVIRWRPTRETVMAANVELLFDRLLNSRAHGFRVIRVGPDNKLYMAIGTPCNVCEPQGFQGSIVRMPLTGGTAEVFAKGIRNSVGFDFHPRTRELWFTDNGSDGLGDDIPPEELNHAPKPGMHFGYPYYGGGDTRPREYRAQAPPAGVTFPAFTFPAHSAALGMHFYRGKMFPAEYQTGAFVAQHGSWNRSVPDGYRVVYVHFDKGRPVKATPFAEGFRINSQTWGRPVGVAELPDGSLLVSSDHGNAVFRIAYRKP